MIRQPSSVTVAGPSGSGKSELVEQWLRYLNVFQVKPKKIVYAYDRWQPPVRPYAKEGWHSVSSRVTGPQSFDQMVWSDTRRSVFLYFNEFLFCYVLHVGKIQKTERKTKHLYIGD